MYELKFSMYLFMILNWYINALFKNTLKNKY